MHMHVVTEQRLLELVRNKAHNVQIPKKQSLYRHRHTYTHRCIYEESHYTHSPTLAT